MITGFIAYSLWLSPTVVSVPLTGAKIPLVVRYDRATVDSYVLYYYGSAICVYSYTYNKTVMLTSTMPSTVFQYSTIGRTVTFIWRRTTPTYARVRYEVA